MRVLLENSFFAFVIFWLRGSMAGNQIEHCMRGRASESERDAEEEERGWERMRLRLIDH